MKRSNARPPPGDFLPFRSGRSMWSYAHPHNTLLFSQTAHTFLEKGRRPIQKGSLTLVFQLKAKNPGRNPTVSKTTVNRMTYVFKHLTFRLEEVLIQLTKNSPSMQLTTARLGRILGRARRGNSIQGHHSGVLFRIRESQVRRDRRKESSSPT